MLGRGQADHLVDLVAEEPLARFEDALGGLVAGDPFDENTTLAPLSSHPAAGLNAQTMAAVAAGATVFAFGSPVPTGGAFVRSTILIDLGRENPA